MNDFWEILWKASIIFSLLNLSVYGIVSKAYQVVKKRIDVQQQIKSPKNSNRLWHWVLFGFLSFYIFFLAWSVVIYVLGPSSTDNFWMDLIGPAFLALPIAVGGMLVGYMYARRIFK